MVYTALMSLEDDPDKFTSNKTNPWNEPKVDDTSPHTSHDCETTIDTSDMTVDPNKETSPDNHNSWIRDYKTMYTSNMTISDRATYSKNRYNASWIPSHDWLLNCTIDFNATATIQGGWKNGPGMTLGDCIKFCACYPATNGNQSFNGMYHARNCMNKTDRKLVNLESVDIIHEIQSHKPGFDIPEPDAIVIHLRLGDIVRSSRASPLEMLVKNSPKALKSIAGLLDNIRTSGVDKLSNRYQKYWTIFERPA